MNKLVTIVLLALVSFQAQAFSNRKVRVDDRLPAGNIVVEKMSGDTVYVQPDLTGNREEWFYWAMRVRGAQGKTLVFKYPRLCVGARGAVVSLDKGKTFFFTGDKAGNSFTYTFGPKDKDVYFYECHPYVPKDWKRFLRTLDKKLYTKGVLCRSVSGKKVPRASFGRLDGEEKHRVVITARHHCSETMASYVMEGVIQGFCADNETGKWLRDNVELTVAPFADFDGSASGDQGKYRAPHDHNRDYVEFLYPETKAISELYVERHAEVILDLHCPWIAQGINEYLYNPLGDPDIIPDIAAEERFISLVDRYAEGLPYDSSYNVPFGTLWNTNKNYADGMSCLSWARMNAPGAHVCLCFEIPFANDNGTEVNPESSRVFGRSLAKTIAAYFRDADR